MRVAVVAAWMKPREAGGMEHYLRNLIEALPRVDDENEYVLFTSEMNHHTFEQLPARWSRVLCHGDDASPSAYRRAPEPDVSLDELFDEHKVDVVFCPFMYVAPHTTRLPSVVTIPDLQHLALPELFEPFELGSRAIGFEHSAQRADVVLAISETVAGEFEREFPQSAGRVVAAPLGLNRDCNVDSAQVDRFADAVRAQWRIDYDFAYFPANAWPHKNHERLLEAFALLLERGSSLHLVMTGSPLRFEERLEAKVYELGLGGRVHHLGYVPRDAVFGLYRAASLLVFPSLFEGFGLPLLEAARFGTPIACSDLPVLREVGDQVALFFDPERPEDIANKTQLAAGMERLSGPHVDETLHRFDYDRTAEITLEAFRRAVSDRREAGDDAIVALDSEGHLQNGFARWTIHSTQPTHIEFAAGLKANGAPTTADVVVAIDGQVVHRLQLNSGQFERLECSVPDLLSAGVSDRWVTVHARQVGSTAPAADVHLSHLSIFDAHFGQLRVL